MKIQSATIKSSDIFTARPKKSFCSAQIHKNKSPDQIIHSKIERYASKRTMINCNRVGLTNNKEGFIPEIKKNKKYVNPLEVIIHRK